MSAGTGAAAIACALAVAAVPPEGPAEVPGGYYEFRETEREPADGHEKVLTGSILLPLGVLRLGMGATMYVISSPDYCKRVYGPMTSESTCNGLQTFGIVGIAMGGLMAITGAVFLGWGLKQRMQHRRWQQGHGLALSPMVGREVRGLSFGFRF
jgi:hypothetical protein